MALSESSPILNYKIYLNESNLLDYINKSVYEEIKQEHETNEILNHLREKYLPTSIRSNSFNKSMNMTYFQKYNSNKLFPAFSEKTSFNDNDNFSKTAYNSHKEFNLNKNMINLKKISDDKIKPYSLLVKKDLYNLGESEKKEKLNKENIYNENPGNIKEKNENIIFKDNLLKEENDILKNKNESYKVIISSLIEYINDISSYFVDEDTIDINYINDILKKNNYKIDYISLNKVKSKLQKMKDNIINFDTIKKSQTLPAKRTDKNKNIFNQAKKPIIKEKEKEKTKIREKIKEKNEEIYDYRPIIIERNYKEEENEKISKSVDKGGIIKKSRTWMDRLPRTYWSLNKKVKFRESKTIKYK